MRWLAACGEWGDRGGAPFPCVQAARHRLSSLGGTYISCSLGQATRQQVQERALEQEEQAWVAERWDPQMAGLPRTQGIEPEMERGMNWRERWAN